MSSTMLPSFKMASKGHGHLSQMHWVPTALAVGSVVIFVTPFIESSWAWLSTSWDVIKKVGSYVAPLFHVLCLTSSLPIPAMLDMSTL